MKKSLIAVVAILLTCTSISYAQTNVDSVQSNYNIYDFDFVGGGTRAKGMGNAFIGVSDDVTGGSWNPAGIFELDKTTMAISWLNMTPKGNSSVQSITQLTESNHSGSLSDISSINFISPVRISGHPFVFSLNLTRNFSSFNQYQSQLDFSQEFITNAPNGVVFYDTNNVNVQSNVRMDGSLNSINLGFGTRLYNNYSFGIAVNIYTGRTLFKVDNVNTIDSMRVFTVQQAQIKEYVNIEDTNKFGGSNFTIGFKYNGDALNAGITIRTPFKLKENRERGVFINTELNGMSLVTDATFKTELYKYDMPMMIGAGFGYNVNENFLLAGDVEYRGFSGKKVNFRVRQTINPGGSNIVEYNTIDPKWDNSLSVRLGGEYIKNFEFGNIPFRAGFGYVPVPGASFDITHSATSTVVNYNFTAGTGIHFEQIHFDFAYMYTKSDAELVDYSENAKNHNIAVSFTGVF